MTDITSHAVAAGLKRIAFAAERFAGELNEADGALGDGDLGITVSKGFAEAATLALPSDVGMAFLECAKAFQRVSASSYGTLVATAFMSAAKACKGREAVPAAEVPALMRGALEAMAARGKGSLNDKTVLDSVAAAAAATANTADTEMLEATVRAAQTTVEAFKSKPAKLGRARSYGERSVGLVGDG